MYDTYYVLVCMLYKRYSYGEGFRRLTALEGII